METLAVIAPHGGRLINRVPREEDDRRAQQERAADLKRLVLGAREVSDLLLLGVGAFSPLEGFMTSADYHAVVRDARLANGLPWTIPITLPVSGETAKSLDLGNFYGPYDAQRIFDHYRPEELGIRPMFFDFTFYCRCCGQIVSEKTCRHDADDRIFFSGTRVREMLARGEGLPEEFTRPEIARILAAAAERHQL